MSELEARVFQKREKPTHTSAISGILPNGRVAQPGETTVNDPTGLRVQ